MMVQYKVTIGIPMFNVENYISRTIESALLQTYQNIEILVIDDASSDKSLEIIKKIQSEHSRGKAIRILSHMYNLGVSETRNQLIDEAKGQYLYFMDSDDVIDKETISLLMNEIDAHLADVAFGSYERIELSGERSLFQYPKMFFSDADSLASYAYQRYAGFQASACNFIVRLSLIRQNHLRFCKADFWEDMVFTLSLVTLAERAVLLPNITYTYLCRENSLSNSWHHNVIAKEKIVLYFMAIEQLKKAKDEFKQKKYYPNRCYFALVSDIYIICNLLKKSEYVKPAFTNKELHTFLKHPATFCEILAFKQKRLKNLLLYTLGILPPFLSVYIVRLFAILKGLF